MDHADRIDDGSMFMCATYAYLAARMLSSCCRDVWDERQVHGSLLPQLVTKNDGL